MTDNSKMPFGKFKGVALGNLNANYLLWLKESGVAKGELLDYILENLEAIKKEVK